MSTDDGGNAFPCFQEISQWNEEKGKYVDLMLPIGGMSLRDWFAGMALQGILAAAKPSDGDLINRNPLHFGRVCFALADAMLAARKQ